MGDLCRRASKSTMGSVTVVAVVLLFVVACGPVSAQETDLNLRPEQVPPAQFRVRCDYSHSNKDDPVLKPNQPNSTHMHDYFGVKHADAYTTDATKFVGQPTTCVLTGDSAAYIFPALYQRSAKKTNGSYTYEHLKPRWTLFYYRTAVRNPEDIITIPPNLTMVTGNATAGLNQQKFVNVEWWCGVYGKHYNNFPEESCAPNVALLGKLNFPSCWDGKNTYSADGRAHMLHVALNSTCPSSHPYAIPRISIKVYYPVRSGLKLTWPKKGVIANPPLFLSTYYTGGTGSGLEYHSDFMNGWKQDVLDDLVKKCINANIKCRVQNDTLVPDKPFADGPSCGGKACT